MCRVGYGDTEVDINCNLGTFCCF